MTDGSYYVHDEETGLFDIIAVANTDGSGHVELNVQPRLQIDEARDMATRILSAIHTLTTTTAEGEAHE